MSRQFAPRSQRPLGLPSRQRAAKKLHTLADALADGQDVRKTVLDLHGITTGLLERLDVVTDATQGSGYCPKCERWMIPENDGDDLVCPRCALVL